MKNSAKFCAYAAIIAALYAALTVLLSPISYGAMQIRVSEALIALAALTPAAVPGITLGCFLSNIVGPTGIVDALIGSAASLLGALCAYLLRKRPAALAFTPNVLINGLAVSLELVFIYDMEEAFLPCFLWVCAGEALACYALGLTLLGAIRHRHDINLESIWKS